jgi:RecA-family ATPase
MTSVSPASSGSQVSYPDPIPGVIPFGTVNLLAGASGAGKTSLLVEWCRAWQQGGMIFGKPVSHLSRIAYLSADRVWQKDHQIWFDRAGLPPIQHYALANDDAIPSTLWTQDKALDLFQHCLAQLSPDPGSLLIVDPMTPLFIAGDQNLPRPVARTLLEFSHTCQRRSLTIIAIAYVGKQRSNGSDRYTRLVDRIAGSGVFAGYSHTQMYLFEPERRQPYYLFGWRPRHAKEEQYRLQRNEQTGLFEPYEPAKDDRLLKFLDLFPKDGLIITYDELVDQAKTIPMSAATVKRILPLLVDSGDIEKVKRGHYRRPIH